MSVSVAAVVLLAVVACGQPTGPQPGPAARMPVTSAAFVDGGDVPVAHTCDGDDVPPPLAWQPPTAGTVEVAVVVDDPDAPRGTFVHWLVAGLPGDLTSLDGPLPPGAVEGRNDFGGIGWAGPCPPAGDDPHAYRFRVLALDEPTGLVDGFAAADLDGAIAGHVLAEGVLGGRYARAGDG